MKKVSLFLALFLAMMLVSGQNIKNLSQSMSSTSGLVAFFPFNGNANDESGNGSNPTYIGTGVTLTSDRFGNPDKAYYFDGNAGSYIRMPADKFPTTDRTISFWFNADQIENHPTPLSYGGDVCYNSLLMIINKGDYPNAYTVLSHCASNFISAPYTEAPVNKWYQLTMTISGATQKIFINGELLQTANTFGTPTVVAGKSAILGAILFTDGVNVYNEPTAGNFQGKMDDFRFYERAMTDSEVKILYNNEADGLVAFYPFNGNAKDETGNGYDGNVSGATSTTDRFNQAGKAYNFVYNGFSSDKIQVSGTSDLNFSSGGFSLSAWVKFSGPATGGNNYPIFSKHICGEQSGYILMLYNGKLTFWLAGSGGYNVLSTTDDYTDNSWHQVVAVYDVATQYIYVDGVLKNSVPFIYNSYNSANWALGGYNGCNGGFNGKVDEIKVFSQALTGAEILDMYNKSANDLVVFLPFNGTANDESGNGHDGTVYGGILTEDRNNNQNSAYTFPNLHDQIVLANTSNLTLEGGFTLNTWVKYKNINCGIVGKHNCWTPNGFLLGIEDGQFTLWISNGGWQIIKTSETYQENKWYMVTAVYDSVNKTGLVYVDGKLKSSGNAIYSGFNAASITISESSGNCPSGNMPGAIDEVKIYYKPLSAGEIQSEYKKYSTSLIAYYPFNGNANDESGNGNDGINHNGIYSKDRFGNNNASMLFTGNDSYVEGANPGITLPTGNSPRTITAWIKGKSFNPYGNNIFHYGLDQAASTNFHLYTTDVVRFGNGYDYGIVAGTTPIVDDAWHFVAGVYEGGTELIAKIYVDGKLDATGNLSTEPNTKLGSNWKIARFMTGSTNFDGEIDEVKVFNKALNETEISQEYNSTRNSQVAYYPFEGNANDESGNGNHGTITGALVTPAADRYGEEGKAYKFWFPDYVSVPTNSSFFTDEFTVSYWYKVEAYWGDRGVLSCVGNKGGYQQVFSAGTTFTYLLGYNFPNSSWFWTNYTVPNTPNTWQHITTTYKKTGDNTSDSKLYINGELKSSDNYGNSIAYPGSEIFYIGRNHSDLGLNGELDEVRLYSKALNDQEILDLYLAESKPVLLNPANQSSVTTLTPEMFWSSPLANAEFRFQLSSDSLFGTILHELLTTELKTQLPDALLTEGQSYYWRVQAKLNGETGPWSSVCSFNFVNTGIDKPNRDVFSVRISPNPVNASAKITYLLPGTGTNGVPVTIEILNSIGTSIKKLDAKKVQRGTNEIEIETGSLQPGIYYCRLKAGNISIVRKLVIMH